MCVGGCACGGLGGSEDDPRQKKAAQPDAQPEAQQQNRSQQTEDASTAHLIMIDGPPHSTRTEGQEGKVGRDLVGVKAGSLRAGVVPRPRVAKRRVGEAFCTEDRGEMMGRWAWLCWPVS